MGFISSVPGIVLIELLALLGLLFFFIGRFTNKKSNNDMAVMSEFLDKIDQETLIRLSNMEHRSENHRETIRKDLEAINSEQCLLKSLLDKAGIITLADNSLSRITHHYLKVITSISAITSREKNQLKHDNEVLSRQLSDASKLINDVTFEYAKVVMRDEDTTRLDESRERILKAIEDAERNLTERERDR